MGQLSSGEGEGSSDRRRRRDTLIRIVRPSSAGLARSCGMPTKGRSGAAQARESEGKIHARAPLTLPLGMPR